MPVIRLQGDDSAVRAVGREAAQVVGAAGQPSAAFFAGLVALHRDRARFLAATAAAVGRADRSGLPTEPGMRAYRVLWATMLGFGLVAAMTSAVLFGAPDRKNSFIDPRGAFTLACVAGVLALATLLVVLLLRVPDRESARVGETCAVLVLALCLWMLGYRLAVGHEDSRGFTAADLAVWMPMTSASVLLIGGIVLRCDPIRRRGRDAPGRARQPAMATEVTERSRRTAARLAAAVRLDERAMTEWQDRLDALRARGIDAATVRQARTMTPASWLAWLAYDGEIGISGVLLR